MYVFVAVRAEGIPFFCFPCANSFFCFPRANSFFWGAKLFIANAKGTSV